MPVRRFRTIEEMETPVWRLPGDPELYRTIERLWAFGARVNPRRFPAGIHRYRSVYELDRQAERWSAAHIAQRRAKKSE